MFFPAPSVQVMFQTSALYLCVSRFIFLARLPAGAAACRVLPVRQISLATPSLVIVYVSSSMQIGIQKSPRRISRDCDSMCARPGLGGGGRSLSCSRSHSSPLKLTGNLLAYGRASRTIIRKYSAPFVYLRGLYISLYIIISRFELPYGVQNACSHRQTTDGAGAVYRHLLCTGAAGCQLGIVIYHIAPTDEGRKCHTEFTAPNVFGVTACLRHRNTLSCHEALCHVIDTDCHFVTILTLFFFVTNVNLVTILTHGVAGPSLSSDDVLASAGSGIQVDAWRKYFVCQ